MVASSPIFETLLEASETDGNSTARIGLNRSVHAPDREIKRKVGSAREINPERFWEWRAEIAVAAYFCHTQLKGSTRQDVGLSYVVLGPEELPLRSLF